MKGFIVGKDAECSFPCISNVVSRILSNNVTGSLFFAKADLKITVFQKKPKILEKHWLISSPAADF